MMLTEIDRERIREVATSITADAGAEEMTELSARTQLVLTMLRKMHPSVSDDALASFAESISVITAKLATMSIRDISPSINAMFTTYALAAGELANVYSVTRAAERDDPGSWPGQYL